VAAPPRLVAAYVEPYGSVAGGKEHGEPGRPGVRWFLVVLAQLQRTVWAYEQPDGEDEEEQDGHDVEPAELRDHEGANPHEEVDGRFGREQGESQKRHEEPGRREEHRGD
jgi:hypothetical protein